MTNLQQLDCYFQHACLLATSCEVGLSAQGMIEVAPLQQPANIECVKSPLARRIHFEYRVSSNLLQNQTEGPI